jgi:transcriptional regulator with XRE-family HTH domain
MSGMKFMELDRGLAPRGGAPTTLDVADGTDGEADRSAYFGQPHAGRIQIFDSGRPGNHPGRLRYPVIQSQRHPVTVFRSNTGMHIGTRIRQRRKERGMSIKELAKLAGMAVSTLSDLERGAQKETTRIYWIAAALDTPIEFFLGHRGAALPKAFRVAEPTAFYGVQLSEAAVHLASEWDKLDEPMRTQMQVMIEGLVAHQVRSKRKRATASEGTRSRGADC